MRVSQRQCYAGRGIAMFCLATTSWMSGCGWFDQRRSRASSGSAQDVEPQEISLPRLVESGSASSEATSPWRDGAFFLASGAALPPTPTIYNPGDRSWVRTSTPILSVRPVAGLPGELVRYEFEVYADQSLSQLLVRSPNPTSSSDFFIGQTLEDRHKYYWRARAERAQHFSPWTTVATFGVKLSEVESPPSIALIRPWGATSAVDALTLRWQDDDPDSSATLSLYFSFTPQATDEESTLIVAGLAEDLENLGDSYTWDLSTVAPGIYFVHASIADATTSVSSPSVGPIKVLPYHDFLTYCQSAGIDTPIRATVTALSAKVGFADCINAAAALEAQDTLNLARLNLTDLRPLYGLQRLRHLDVSENSITDLSPLAGVPALITLDATNNLVADLAPLVGHHAMTTLNLGASAVRSLSPLGGLGSLRTLRFAPTVLTRGEESCPVATLSAAVNRFCARFND